MTLVARDEMSSPLFVPKGPQFLCMYALRTDGGEIGLDCIRKRIYLIHTARANKQTQTSLKTAHVSGCCDAVLQPPKNVLQSLRRRKRCTKMETLGGMCVKTQIFV